MQNNRCIGPIHAVAQWTKRCARQSHGVGSNPIGGSFGNIFIDFVFVWLNPSKMWPAERTQDFHQNMTFDPIIDGTLGAATPNQ